MTGDEIRSNEFKKMKESLARLAKEKDSREVKTGYQPNGITLKKLLTGQPIGIENKLIQQWMKEFDEIYEKTGKPGEGTKRIVYDDIPMNQIEFLEYKHEQYNQE